MRTAYVALDEQECTDLLTVLEYHSGEMRRARARMDGRAGAQLGEIAQRSLALRDAIRQRWEAAEKTGESDE